MGEVEFSKTNLDDRLKFSPKALIETKKTDCPKPTTLQTIRFFMLLQMVTAPYSREVPKDGLAPPHRHVSD